MQIRIKHRGFSVHQWYRLSDSKRRFTKVFQV